MKHAVIYFFMPVIYCANVYSIRLIYEPSVEGQTQQYAVLDQETLAAKDFSKMTDTTPQIFL